MKRGNLGTCTTTPRWGHCLLLYRIMEYRNQWLTPALEIKVSMLKVLMI